MNKEQAPQTYQQMKHRLFFVGLALDVLVLLLFFFSGNSLLLKNFASQFSSQSFVIIGIYLLFLGVILYVVHFPLNLFSGFIWEHKFHLSTQKFSFSTSAFWFHILYDDISPLHDQRGGSEALQALVKRIACI